MNCNLSPDEIKKVKTKFAAWQELQGEKKELSEAEKDVKNQAAEIIDGKVADVGKLFKAMQQMYDGVDNDLDEIGSVLECIRSNGSCTEDSDKEDSDKEDS